MSISHGTAIVHKGQGRPKETGFIVNADTTVLALEGEAADTLRQKIATLGDYVTYITTQSPEAVATRLSGQSRHKTELGRQALLGTLHKAWRFLHDPTELTLVTGTQVSDETIELVTYPVGRMSLNRDPHALTTDMLERVFPQAFLMPQDVPEQTAGAFALAGPANTVR